MQFIDKEIYSRQTGIYCIKNLVNGKFYIGSARRSFAHRISGHLHRLRNNTRNNPKLQNAWNKYGEESFIFFVLETIPKEECEDKQYVLEIEQWYVDTFDAVKTGYNIREKVDSPEGLKRSKEACEKHSLSMQGVGAKEFTVISPDREIITYKGLQKFAIEFKVEYGNFGKFLNTSQRSCCGWYKTLEEYDEDNRLFYLKHLDTKKLIKLKRKDFNKFATSNVLCSKQLKDHLINGKFRFVGRFIRSDLYGAYYKKWLKPFKLKNKETDEEVILTREKINKFCIERGLGRGNIYQVVDGKNRVKSHRNWFLVKENGS